MQEEQQLELNENKLISSVLSYWFGDSIQNTTLSNSQKSVLYQELWDSTWFGGLYSKEVDEYITQHYGTTLELAANGKLQHLEQSALGCLTLIILFDQFSRNIFRNRSESFQYDPLALQLTKRCVREELDRELIPIARAFLYLPLLHSENLEDQMESVRLFKKLSDENDAKIPVMFARFATLAVEKQKEIQRFGRFPKRNKILGRLSTNEENEVYGFPFH